MTTIYIRQLLLLQCLFESVLTFTPSSLLTGNDLARLSHSVLKTRLGFKEDFKNEDDSKELQSMSELISPVNDYYDDYGSLEDTECDISDDKNYQTLVEEMAESIDVARETSRLDAFGEYIVVSCLTATSSVGICTGVEGFSRLTTLDYIFQTVNVVAATLCSLTGLYATVVFSLCTIYGRTAIGLRRDSAYDDFIVNSGGYRVKAFRAYVASIALFLLQIVTISAEQLDDRIRYPFMITFSIAALFAYRDWESLMGLAGPIFAPPTNDEPSK